MCIISIPKSGSTIIVYGSRASPGKAFYKRVFNIKHTLTNSSERNFLSLSRDVRAAILRKRALGWDLEELENAAKESMERTPDSDDEEDEPIERMRPVLL